MSKRVLDMALASVALVVLSPLMLAIAVLVRIRLGTPILFRQERAGLGGRPFTLYKFRTMTDACDKQGVLQPDAQRVTPFGGRLRSLSLDEIPELWNILRGDMSVVGPRPLPTAYLPRYTSEERRRHDVLPGLTGWAQINGRNAVEWDARLAMDVWYVDHRSMRLDARIIARTVRAVVSQSGINAEGEATMGELRPRREAAGRAGPLVGGDAP